MRFLKGNLKLKREAERVLNQIDKSTIFIPKTIQNGWRYCWFY